jgi:hypothetical protein
MITVRRIIRALIIFPIWLPLNVIGYLADWYVDNIWKVMEPLEVWVRGRT